MFVLLLTEETTTETKTLNLYNNTVYMCYSGQHLVA